jgi:hypothetical protein
MPITTLFLDVGGVLLTNGWDHHARRRAAKHFGLPWVELQDRHGLMFETHEEGKLTFDEYLDRLVFYRKRPFTRAQFRSFMFSQSRPDSICFVDSMRFVFRPMVGMRPEVSTRVKTFLQPYFAFSNSPYMPHHTVRHP